MKKMTNVSDVTKGDWSFGLSFLSQLGTGNASLSPYSVRTALALLYEGATGETAKQIAHVAAFPEDESTRHAGFKSLIESFNKISEPILSFCRFWLNIEIMNDKASGKMIGWNLVSNWKLFGLG